MNIYDVWASFNVWRRALASDYVTAGFEPANSLRWRDRVTQVSSFSCDKRCWFWAIVIEISSNIYFGNIAHGKPASRNHFLLLIVIFPLPASLLPFSPQFQQIYFRLISICRKRKKRLGAPVERSVAYSHSQVDFFFLTHFQCHANGYKQRREGWELLSTRNSFEGLRTFSRFKAA